MDKKKSTTLKEIRSKMKRLALQAKRQVKEEKQMEIKQEKQKEKESKQKGKITQRVKININIPSQHTSPPQIQNPFYSSNRDQISLLTSINEQLKKKDEARPTTATFKIPMPQTIETQTEPTQTYTQQTQTKKAKPIETQTEPTQTYTQQTQIKKGKPIETQTEEPSNLFNTENDYMLQEELRNEKLLLDRRLGNLQQEFNEKTLPPQFSEKEIQRAPIIEEPTQPIITKPKDTTEESILEQLETKKRGRARLTEEEIQRREQEAEIILRKKMNDKEIEKQQKEEANRELKERLARQKAADRQEKQQKEEADRELKEQLARQKEADRQEKAQRVENSKIEETRKKLIEKDNKKKQQTDNAFNVLVENTKPEERADLIEGYKRGYINESIIREKLKNLKNDSARRKFTQEQINGFFKPPFR